MKNLFLKIKPCAVLLLLKDSQQAWYPSKLARTAGISYVHTANLLVDLAAQGVVVAEKKGKQNMYKLTERGAMLASALDDFSKKCDASELEAKEKAAAASQAKSEEKPQHHSGASQGEQPKS